jgi:hypothetical protein
MTKDFGELERAGHTSHQVGRAIDLIESERTGRSGASRILTDLVKHEPLGHAAALATCKREEEKAPASRAQP